VNTDLQFSVDVDLVYFLNVLAQHFSESRDVLAHCPLFHKVPKSLDAALKLARALRPSTLALSVVTTTLLVVPFTAALNRLCLFLIRYSMTHLTVSSTVEARRVLYDEIFFQYHKRFPLSYM
jgi:hypothetical protein